MTTPKHPYANKLPYTLQTWRECVIWCACEGGGWREVHARVYGALCLHESLRGNHCHTITHIPTGKRMLDVAGEQRVGMCEFIIERLTSLGDWNTRSVGKLKALREAM